MSNSIALITKHLSILDEVFKKSTLTNVLDNTRLTQETNEANTIKIAKMVLQGLGDYDRNTGYVDGDATLTYETHTFSQDRGRKFGIDSMDNVETAGIGFGALAGEFLRVHVAPEVDAYRFSLYHSKAGNSAQADITTSTALLTAIDTALKTMDDAEVPEEGRILFLNNNNYNLLKNAPSLSRSIGQGNDEKFNRTFMTFDNMRCVKVPQGRFIDSITQNDGATAGQEAGGFIKTPTTGRDLNFQIIHPSAIGYQGNKHVVNKIISPELNQTSDAWLFFYRLYHDVFVLDNKVDAIYSHNKAT